MNQTKDEVIIKEFNPNEASEKEFAELIQHKIAINKEIDKYDRSSPELIKKSLNKSIPFYQRRIWILYKNEILIGQGQFFRRTKESPEFKTKGHQLNINISIKSEYRNNGYGTKLLKYILKNTYDQSIKIVDTWTLLENGHKFTEKFGGKIALTMYKNRLKLENVDWELMSKWKKVPDGFSTYFFEELDENISDEFLSIYNEIDNQVPRGDLNGEYVITYQVRKEYETRYKKIGTKWITLIIKNDKDKICGLTEILWNSSESYKIIQELTGVLEKYRNHGLGKLLKSKMLFYIKDNLSSVEIIDTSNANVNAPMRYVNEKVGFKQIGERRGYLFDYENLYDKISSE